MSEGIAPFWRDESNGLKVKLTVFAGEGRGIISNLDRTHITLKKHCMNWINAFLQPLKEVTVYTLVSVGAGLVLWETHVQHQYLVRNVSCHISSLFIVTKLYVSYLISLIPKPLQFLSLVKQLRGGHSRTCHT